MADDRIEKMLYTLNLQRQKIQDKLMRNRKKTTIIQKDNTRLDQQVLVLDKKISKIKIQASRDQAKEQQKQEKEQDQQDSGLPQEPAMEFEEAPAGAPVAGDGATSTAALDGSSTSTGGDFGGWRHYKKIGDIKKRDYKKNKTIIKIHEFMDHYFDDQIEDGS